MNDTIPCAVSSWLVDDAALDHAESRELIRDLAAVYRCTMQSMPVIGSWLERRVADLVARKVRYPLRIAEQAQIFDPNRPTIRSRSWDIILYDPDGLTVGLPPPPRENTGPSLLPLSACKAVIDTKTYISDVHAYAAKVCFDRAKPFDQSDLRQLEFLGPIPKVLLIGYTRGSPERLSIAGSEVGMTVHCLARSRCVRGCITPDGFDTREWLLSLVPCAGGAAPLQQFLEMITAL